MLNQISTHYHFDTSTPSHATLTSHTQARFVPPADATQGFTILLTMRLDPHAPASDILTIPGVVHVSTRSHEPRDRSIQNYPAFAMPDGSVPVLEASITLYAPQFPAGKEMVIGVPLAMVPPSTGTHQVVLHFSGVHWALYVDGMLYDRDFPLGYPRWPDTPTWYRDATHTIQATLWVPALTPHTADSIITPVPLHYWTPPGHNTWVGDVVTCMHAGHYHVFYLYDRRHHHSKFGMGAHFFAHLSTHDFITWTMHDDATPLEAQWECIGTGTPFIDNDGRLCLAYALHTERMYADSDTTLPAQLAWLETHGATGSFDHTTPGIPIGATYAISADGIAQFHKTGIFYHPCRNPSIYRDQHGALRMLANYAGAAGATWGKGMWSSDHVDGGWHCVNADFPPGGDCTFFFRWGQFDYIIGGFVHLWMKAIDAPDSAYHDLVSQGMDCYDGLNVPAICEVAPGRWLMAGWNAIQGWGGTLVIRELIQFADGRLGTRWLPELVSASEPGSVRAVTHDGDTTIISMAVHSFVWEYVLQPQADGRGTIRVCFLPAHGDDHACEWQLDIGAGRAQFAPGTRTTYAPRQRSLREGGNPAQGGDYAIEHPWSNSEPIMVRMMVKGDAKLGGSLIDVEIAGQRTMLTFRPDLWVGTLLLRVK
ncbi:MAG: hypothetical protein ACK5C8_14300 [Roseiflexaceae bacterium]|jgi:hypothetical protein